MAVRVDGDTEHFGANAAVEALDHAVGLRCAGAGVTILGAEGGEGRGEATAVIGQHVRETEEGSRGLAQEGDGALLGLVVLDREVDGARAPVEGDAEITLAPLAVAGLQLGPVLAVDGDEAEVIVADRALALGGAFGSRLGPATEALGLAKAPDVVATEMRQEVANDAGEVVKREVGRPPQGAYPRTLFLARLPWQPVWPGGAVEAIRSTALAPLAHGPGADAAAPGKHA